MKKMLSMLLVAVMMCTALCCGAMAEAADVTGEWYGSLFGMTMTLTLNEDGTYVMDMGDDDPSEGTWKLDGESLIMDEGADGEITFAYDGSSLYADAGDGMEFLFTREPVAAFEPAAARTDATLEEYAGSWTCTLVSMMGMQLPPELAEIELSMIIDGENVNLTLGLYGEPITADLTAPFADGAMTLTVPSEYEDEEDTVFTLQLLEDGTMSAETTMFEETCTFYLTAAEAE